jgi:hypothetical protein
VKVVRDVVEVCFVLLGMRSRSARAVLPAAPGSNHISGALRLLD